MRSRIEAIWWPAVAELPSDWRTLTAAGALVRLGDAVLMVRQRRPSGLWWEVPSGYAEPNESLEQTAAREVEEETGMAIRVGRIACTFMCEWATQRRRHLVAFFDAAPTTDDFELRPQPDEGVEEVAFRSVAALHDPDFHPLEQIVLERWLDQVPAQPFHLFVDVRENSDGNVKYVPRADDASPAGAWREYVAGEPRLAEDAYSWTRSDVPEGVSFAPTPGPGDSDGGDLYPP